MNRGYGRAVYRYRTIGFTTIEVCATLCDFRIDASGFDEPQHRQP